MTDGLGAGFSAASLLFVVSLFAVALGAIAAVAAAVHRRTGTVPGAVRSFAGIFLLGVSVTAGVGLLALADSAPLVVALVALTIPVPVAIVSADLRFNRGSSPPDAVLAAGVAWGGPFLVGMGAFHGLTLGLRRALGSDPGASRWALVAVASAVVVAGGILVGRRVARLLPPRSGLGDLGRHGVAAGAVAGLIAGVGLAVLLGLDGLALLGLLGVGSWVGGVIGGSLR